MIQLLFFYFCSMQDVLAIVINDRMTVLQQRQQLESDFKSSLSWRD
uniref:Uncharacterized protein n=1 Tax=Solanum lycopersicum TaxID=4081 RepID=A0A3Q7HA20_SOLLC